MSQTTQRLQLTLIAVAWCLQACDMNEQFRVDSDPKAPFTEAVALDAARRALENAGYDVAALEPVCYSRDCSDPEKYFARNTLQPNMGYILWRFKGVTKTLYQLDVRLIKEDGHISCAVSVPK